jgi:predicted O-linked N-acetylglucosamine transferase (SPINDLY family)
VKIQFNSNSERQFQKKLDLKVRQIAANLSPNDAELANALGSAFAELDKIQQAAFYYCRAIELAPHYAPAYNNLGNLFKKTKRFAQAKICLEKAIELRPDIPDFYNNLANVMIEMGEVEEAEKLFLQALEQKPDCLKTYDNFLFIANHNPKNSPQDCLNFAKHFGDMAAKRVSARFTHEAKKQNVAARLKIGVVSGDLREHPVSYFLERFFKSFSEGEFELFAYPTTFQQDETTQRFKTYFSHWKPITNLDDKAASTLIYNDGIHILLDLSGHTGKNRLPVFAWKPAPIQISWLGYPATTGLKEMDFYLVDEDWCPKGMMDDLFVEKLLRLNVTAGTFSVPDDIPQITDAPCLKNGFITFGSFNRTEKISSETFDLWCATLNALPDSKMILGNVSDKNLQQRLEVEFAKRAVGRDRLIFHPRLPIHEYLTLHAQIDMVLDTSPYAGGTTSVFAILMGVPVLTLAGQTLVSRVGVTILSCAGIEKDFVAHSTEQFIDIAKHWANAPQALQKARYQLRETATHSEKCHPDNIAREIERTFKQLWVQFCEQ